MSFQAEFVSGRGMAEERAVGSSAARWGVGPEHPSDAGVGIIPAAQPKAGWQGSSSAAEQARSWRWEVNSHNQISQLVSRVQLPAPPCSCHASRRKAPAWALRESLAGNTRWGTQHLGAPPSPGP